MLSAPQSKRQVRLWLGITAVVLTLFINAALTRGAAAQNGDDYFTYLPLVTRQTGEPVPFGPIHNGEGTYYVEADGSGNCSFDPTPDDLMVAAANDVDYANAALCGAYAAVTGPKGSVVVRIVDRCPGCAAGDLDFSPEAFARIADLPQGRVPIGWQLVSPVLAGPIVYHFKDGSSRWWTAVQIRHHRNPIAQFEYWTGSAFQEVPRYQYNYFVEVGGMGDGPYTFRVTDVFGHQIVDSSVPLLNDAEFAGQAQFPPPP